MRLSVFICLLKVFNCVPKCEDKINLLGFMGKICKLQRIIYPQTPNQVRQPQPHEIMI